MQPIKPAFTRAASAYYGFSTFWLLVFAIAILDDTQRREEQRRKRNQRLKHEQRKSKRKAKRKHKPPTGPQPC